VVPGTLESKEGGIVADYSRFDPAIVPWLKEVWNERQSIEMGVKAAGRRQGAKEI
jgi:hypothetical protein